MCKKLFFVLAATLVAWISGNAQPIVSYEFMCTKGTWTEITDGTKMEVPVDNEETGVSYDNNVWMGSTTASSNAVTGTGFPIGFDFVYNSKVMTGFAINSHLQVQLGSGEFTVDPNRSRFFFMDNDEDDEVNVIGASPNMDVFGRADTEISYKMIGEAPNRTLVVQFKNVHAAMSWDGSTSAPVDLQIRLNETSNTIDMVFNGWMEQIGDYSKDVRVGIKGDNADLPADGDTKTYTVSLKGFSGNIRLGLLVSGTTGYANSLLLDDVAVTESCPNDVVITMEELFGTMATVAWTGTKDDDQEWMVFIRKAGDTSKDYVKTVENTMTFEDLETRTNYEIGVTKACAEDDIARPVILAFTTLADDPCFPLENVNATSDVFSITLDWEGDAYAYNIRYRKATEQNWTEVKEVTGNTYTINDLSPASSYLYQVQVLCSLAEGDYSDWSEVKYVITKAETCFAPENIVVEPTHNSAMVTWTADESSFDLEYRLMTDEEWNVISVNDAYELKLNDLAPESTYQLRMRSYCEDSQVSRYSEIISFTTLAIPECVVPSNLRVENIEENAATLLWDAHESNVYWQIKWRESSSTTWNEPGDLTATSYQMTDLVANTAYIWQVKAFCDEGRESDWAVQNKFTTLETGIDAITTADLTVFGKAGVINILNAQNIFIDNVAVYALNGALLGSFDVNAAENVMIPTDIADNAVVVCVSSGAQTLTFKVVIK